MYHCCMYKFSRTFHHSSRAEETVLQSQEVCWTSSKRPPSHAKCILSVGEGQVSPKASCYVIIMWWSCDYYVFSQQGEQAEWDFCQSNFLANSSLRMAGEARVSTPPPQHTHIHHAFSNRSSLSSYFSVLAFQRSVLYLVP